MHLYQAFGLVIESDFALPELLPTTSALPADVIIRRMSAVAQQGSDHQATTAFWIDTPGGRFLIRDECEIVAQVTPEINELSLRTHLLGPILAALLRLRRLLVLHASGIALDGGAVLFLGDSGWGKSTLAQAFCADGNALIADDLNAIQVEAERLTVLPGYPQLKLWSDAATALVETPKLITSQCAQMPKQHHLPATFSAQPLPLKHIYVLGPASVEDSLRLLPTHEALLALVRFSRYAHVPTRTDLHRLHFQQCAQVANMVPVSLVHRRRSLERLSALVDLIKRDLSVAII